MQNTLANRCQTRINGGCEVESFNPHHGSWCAHGSRPQGRHAPRSCGLAWGDGDATLGFCKSVDAPLPPRQRRNWANRDAGLEGLSNVIASPLLLYSICSHSLSADGGSLQIPRHKTVGADSGLPFLQLSLGAALLSPKLGRCSKPFSASSETRGKRHITRPAMMGHRQGGTAKVFLRGPEPSA